MVGRVDNENALKEMVASGLFPCIKRAMQKYEDAEDSEKSLYSTAFEIGEYVDTYYKIFQTGNSVEMVAEYHGTEDMDGLYYCPICKQTTTVVKDGDKCPKCGATMDELSSERNRPRRNRHDRE